MQADKVSQHDGQSCLCISTDMLGPQLLNMHQKTTASSQALQEEHCSRTARFQEKRNPAKSLSIPSGGQQAWVFVVKKYWMSQMGQQSATTVLAAGCLQLTASRSASSQQDTLHL